MELNRFVKTVASTLGAEFSIHLLTLGTTVLVVRSLTPADYGALSLFMIFSQTLGYLANLGLPQAIIFYIGKQRTNLARLATNALFLQSVIGIITAGLVYGLRPLLAGTFLKTLPVTIYPWLLVMFLANLIDNFAFSINRALQQFFIFNLRRMLTPAFYLIAMLICFALHQVHFDRIIGIYVTIQCALTLLFLIQTLRQTKLDWKIDWRLNRGMTLYGIKSYLQILAGHLVYQIDIYLIAALTNASQVAFYSLAVGLANLIWYLPNTVGLVLFPTLSAVQEATEIHRFSARVCRHTLWLTALAGLGLAVAGPWCIQIFYGAKYLAAAKVIWYIMPGVVIMSIYKVLTRNFSSRNRQQIPMVAAALALLVNVALNFWWIPRYGIYGAAVASTISYTLAGGWLLFKVRQESKLPWREFLVLSQEDWSFYRNLFARSRQDVATQI